MTQEKNHLCIQQSNPSAVRRQGLIEAFAADTEEGQLDTQQVWSGVAGIVLLPLDHTVDPPWNLAGVHCHNKKKERKKKRGREKSKKIISELTRKKMTWLQIEIFNDILQVCAGNSLVLVHSWKWCCVVYLNCSIPALFEMLRLESWQGCTMIFFSLSCLFLKKYS